MTALLLLLFATAAATERAEDLLLAPCCYSEAVATHQSEAAVKMRAEIAQLRGAGKSEREIIDHYKAIYGQRILMVPEGAQRWVVFGVPLLVTILGAIMVVLLIRRMHRAHEAAA